MKTAKNIKQLPAAKLGYVMKLLGLYFEKERKLKKEKKRIPNK